MKIDQYTVDCIKSFLEQLKGSSAIMLMNDKNEFWAVDKTRLIEYLEWSLNENNPR